MNIGKMNHGVRPEYMVVARSDDRRPKPQLQWSCRQVTKPMSSKELRAAALQDIGRRVQPDGKMARHEEGAEFAASGLSAKASVREHLSVDC
ncbi:hypothetical protein [Sinorhizobium chiapasense]|uniref:Uncharacterized protein n=1 Tax=Sinorhizobium chiapasense TaxID=501572 RepID=A0ABZ2BHW5_9HYPH